MKKINVLIVLAVLLVFLPYIAHALSVFTVQETEKVQLEPQATDPDNDDLVITYGAPLDKNGEWQTTYGDAGEYKTKITASDGLAVASEDITIIVKRKEEPPVIDFYSPEEDPVKLGEDHAINFRIIASDLNRDPLTYEWLFDGKKVGEGQEFSYTPSYKDSGKYKVAVFVSDNLHVVSQQWDLEVKDFDIQRMLDGIPDVTVNENEIASLELPDFDGYGLAYTISDPIGNDNGWQTGFDDAGIYEIKVHAEGNGFKGDTIVKLTVNDVDRAPSFEEVPNQFIDENQELRITLSASDPDSDKVTFLVENMPEGAKLVDNIFLWKPDFDTVIKTSFVDYFVENFKPLTETFYLKFKASANNKEVVRNVIVTVKDVNRAPVIADLPPINIKESESFELKPYVYDLDGDKVTLEYSGFTDKSTYRSDFDDAGIYAVTVTANDGMLETSKDFTIIINETNRAPVFSKIEDTKASEGDKVAIVMNAYDPDGNSLSYSIENPPEDFTLNHNVFEWTPSFSSAPKGGTKRYDLVMLVSDGKVVASQTATVYVADRNRAPKIINASKSVVGRVNEPVLMSVKAMDEDGDELAYTWDFGLLEKYEATSSHQRTFSTPGSKVVKVTVSDGRDEVEQTINVFIREGAAPDYPVFNESVLIKTRKINITFREKKSFTRTLTPVEVRQDISGKTPVGRNSPPVITEANTNVVAYVNKPVLLSVKAVDPDNDPLTYTWDFGFFDTHKGRSNHQRTFSTAGLKEIEVIVSDGHYNVRHLMYVNVI